MAEGLLSSHHLSLHWLLEKGCCPHCAFRFVNRSPAHFFSQDSETLENIFKSLKKEDNISKNESLWNPPSCISCLGIIPFIQTKEFQDAFFEKLSECGYEFLDYNLAISLPTSILIRQTYLFYLLEENKTFSFLQKDHVVEIKDIIKWLLASFVQQRTTKIFNSSSDFHISVEFQHNETSSDHEFLNKIQGVQLKATKKLPKGSKQSKTVSITQVSKVLSMTDKTHFMEAAAHTLLTPITSLPAFDISFKRDSIFVAGRYIKYSRTLSQTLWIVNGKRKTENSVEEIISSCLEPYFHHKECKFQSAGREDSDVRMLGKGRPFAIELIDPRIAHIDNSSFENIESSLKSNSSILHVRDLQCISKEDCSKMKEGEETKKKTYRCVVWVSEPVSSLDLSPLKNIKDLEIDQKTPLRVLHRRSLATRKKIIHSLSYTKIAENFLVVELVTSAGTYP